MTNVHCVRADFGTYANQFIKRGYTAIGIPSPEKGGA